MPNLQPLIDNLPMILVSLGFLLWGAAKALTAYANRDNTLDAWDTRAAMLGNVSARYAQAIEWLVSSGYCKWSGAQKLEQLNKMVSEFEKLVDQGEYVKAIASLSGFYQSAMSKINKVRDTALGGVSGGASAGEESETDPLATTPASEDSK